MSDVFDKAQERDAEALQDALAAQQLRAASETRLQPSGECHNPRCGEELAPGQLFCGAACAATYQRIVKR